MVKKTKDRSQSTEKILALAGLCVVLVGCFANLYSAFVNQRFIHDGIDLFYYIRYIMILGGGFGIGYLLSRFMSSKTQSLYKNLYSGAFYAVLAIATYELLDLLFFSAGRSTGLPFPWGKFLFQGESIIAFAITLVIALIAYRTSKTRHPAFIKSAVATAFVINQVYLLGTQLPIHQGQSEYGPWWLIVLSLIVNPLVIAIVSYGLLGKTKQKIDRLFYAVYIGIVCEWLARVLWELQMNAAIDAFYTFIGLVTAIEVLFVAAILWSIRKTQ